MKLFVIKLHLKKSICVLSSVILILSGCSATKSEIKSSDTSSDMQKVTDYLKVDDTFDKQVKNVEGLKLVKENNNLQLFVNGKTSEVAVKEIASGAMWYTNPINREADTIAVGSYKDELNSQITMQYTDDTDKNRFVSSFFDSVSLGQYSFYNIPNGIRVNYILGKVKKQYVVPYIVSVDRYNSILAKLDESEKAELLPYYNLVSIKGEISEGDKALLLQKYPILEKRDVYVLSTGFTTEDISFPDFLLNNLEKYFVKAGYTLDALKQDNADNLVKEKEEKNYSIKISVEYMLNETDLIVRIPKDSIIYDEKVIKVTKLSLLQFFGCAGQDKNGYMFIPDGSGALIYLNNGKTNVNSYSKEVYGRDRSIVLSKVDQGDGTQIYLPLYGIKQNDNAFLAVIESGDSVSQINADISGKNTSYNFAYPTFTLKQKAQQKNSIVNISGNNVYQKKPFSEDIQVRFMFLKNENSDYTGMALAYQKYLLGKGKITKQAFENKDLGFNLTTIGAVSYDTTFLGLPVKADKVLTSYLNAIEIIKKLKENGINNINLNYLAWGNGGFNNKVFKNADFISSLGGEKDFIALNQYAKANGINLFPDVNLMYVKQSNILDGFNINTEASRDLANTIAYDYEYKLSTLEKNVDTKKVIVSPARYVDIMNSFLNGFQKYAVKGISLYNVGEELNSDFKSDNIIDRQNAIEKIHSSMKKMTDKGYKIAVNGGNAYSLQYASVVNGIPLSSCKNYIFDESVPFFQIALHGIIPYTSNPMNMSSDYKYDALKLIETGTLPSFKWIFEDNSELKETEYNFYSVNYSTWMNDASKLYKEMSDVLGSCQKSIIVSHNKLQSGLYQTKYENGTTIYVNYNDYEVKYNNILIDKMGYKMVKEEK